jgi:hypothetical protein
MVSTDERQVHRGRHRAGFPSGGGPEAAIDQARNATRAPGAGHQEAAGKMERMTSGAQIR